jgi:hypothetical protein
METVILGSGNARLVLHLRKLARPQPGNLSKWIVRYPKGDGGPALTYTVSICRGYIKRRPEALSPGYSGWFHSTPTLPISRSSIQHGNDCGWLGYIWAKNPRVSATNLRSPTLQVACGLTVKGEFRFLDGYDLRMREPRTA